MTKTDKYWWRYGSASFGLESCQRSIELRRAKALSILVCCRQFYVEI